MGLDPISTGTLGHLGVPPPLKWEQNKMGGPNPCTPPSTVAPLL